MRVDDLHFFEALADAMNGDPGRFRPYGEADMVVEVVMRRRDGAFRARLVFDGLTCTVAAPDGGEACDYSLDGPVGAWERMFASIAASGRAEGLQTINSAVMLGDEIALVGRDPMGLDKFSRFNQTLQEYLDGAARVQAAAPSAVPATVPSAVAAR